MVDPKTKAIISDLRLPCLQFASTSCKWLLFPQVTLDARKALYRLDALACVIHDGQRHWIDVEVDGPGHDSAFDKEREGLLGVATLRIDRNDLRRRDMLEVLEQRLLPLLALRDAG